MSFKLQGESDLELFLNFFGINRIENEKGTVMVNAPVPIQNDGLKYETMDLDSMCTNPVYLGFLDGLNMKNEPSEKIYSAIKDKPIGNLWEQDEKGLLNFHYSFNHGKVIGSNVRYMLVC